MAAGHRCFAEQCDGYREAATPGRAAGPPRSKLVWAYIGPGPRRPIMGLRFSYSGGGPSGPPGTRTLNLLTNGNAVAKGRTGGQTAA